MLRGDYVASRVAASTPRRGEWVLYRLRSVLQGRDAYPNPPDCGAMSVKLPALAGQRNFTIAAPNFSGRIVEGDMLIARFPYDLTARYPGVAGGIPGSRSYVDTTGAIVTLEPNQLLLTVTSRLNGMLVDDYNCVLTDGNGVPLESGDTVASDGDWRCMRDECAGVGFDLPLPVELVAGSALLPVWAADRPLNCRVESENLEFDDGEVVTTYRIMLPAVLLAAVSYRVPETNDRVWVRGRMRTVAAVSIQATNGVLSAYELVVR